METTPLDGYKKIIVTLLTLAAAAAGLFITDPAKAATIGQFLVDVLGPVLITIVGIIYTVVQGNIDKEKVRVVGIAAKAASPKAEGAPSAQAAAPLVPASLSTVPGPRSYVPLDIDAVIGAAEERSRKDGVEVTPLSRAYYFYPFMCNFDLREIPRAERISEAKRLVDKSVDLFIEAFKYQTKLPKPPTPAEAANYHAYMLKLKKDYEKANGLTCSDSTFEHLRSTVSYFNELYSAQDGLSQLSGKTVDWSIYGSGSFTPTQVGWDYVKLL